VFTTTPGTKCGGSCDAPDDQSLIRGASAYGRFNTTTDGQRWLDSNDNEAINLAASANEKFNMISLFPTDIDDVGPVRFALNVDGLEMNIGQDIFNGTKQKNGRLYLLNIKLDALTFASDISFSIDDGDGFGIDDVRLGATPVPVPATLPLLAGGLGLAGWIARRRRG
ncbi:MAG: PEP-CTERM sorting domain-containing protein, partial [Arenibacterium sp.]